jgi:histidinol-phosphate aminotransferase
MKHTRKKAGQIRFSLISSWIWVIFFIACFISCRQLAVTGIDEQKIIQLSLNESPFGMAKGVEEGLLKELPHIARYSGQAGERFVRSVAAHEGVETEQIIPGEILECLGIYLGIKGGAGREFIYSVPGYPALVNAAEKVGGKVVAIPLNDRLENDFEALEARVNDRTAALFLVNPHNPSGTVSEKGMLHDFLKRLSKRTLIIVDEAYLEYADNFSGRTAVNNLKEGDNVIVFRTMSKAYGLAGLSFGYAIAPKALAQDFMAGGWVGIQALNRLSLAAAEAALKDQVYVSRVNQLVTRERNRWHAFLDELGLQHTASMANFVFFDAKKPHADVRDRLKRAGIIVGRSFEPYNTWIRVTIGQPEENAKVQSVIQEIVHQRH